MNTRRLTTSLVCWLLGLAMVASACAGPATTVAPPPTAASAPTASALPPTESPTVVPTPEVQTSGFDKLGPVTLAFWHNETLTGPMTSIAELTTAFEAKYPNVTIQITAKDFNDLQAIEKLTLSGPDAPCLIEGNQGRATDGEIIKAGLIVPLDKYAKAYGWLDRYPPGLLEEFRWTPDGKTFGQGSIYGISQGAIYVGIFYNKDKVAKLGVPWPPKSLDEFETALQAAKAAGELPIQLGNLDVWPGIEDAFGFLHGYYAVSGENERSWALGGPGLSFATPENLEAATKLQEWAQEGYFSKDAAGIGYDASVANFVKGQGVFLFDGFWASGGLYDGMKDKVGFVNPPAGPSGKVVVTGAMDQPLHISSACKYPDLAAAYLDFITNQDAAPTLIKWSRVPAVPAAQVPPETTSLEQAQIAAWSDVRAADGMGYFPDWATVTMYDTLGSQIQQLMAGKITPQQFVANVQADYAKSQSGQGQ